MAQSFDRWLIRYAEGIVRWRWLVLLATFVALAVMLAGARHLSFSADFRVYFGPDNPQLQAFDEVQAVYTKNDNTLYVIEPPGDDAYKPDTLRLLRELTERAWQLDYVIRVDSVSNFQHTEAQGDDLKVADLVGPVEELAPADFARIREIATGEPLLRNRLTSARGHVLAVNVTHQLPEQSADELPTVVAASRALRDEMLAQYPGHSMYLSGTNMMSNAFAEASQADAKTLFPTMYGLLVLILYLLLRSVNATIATLLVIIFSAAGAMGLAGYLGMTLTSPSVIAPIVITTLAVADSVHILVSMLAQMRDGQAQRPALVEALRLNFMPVTLTSVTTALGLLSINFADSPPLADLGNMSAIGTMLAWALSITFLPALLAILPIRTPRARQRTLSAGMEAFGRFVVRRHRAVMAASLVVILALLALAPRNTANDTFVHYFDQRIEFRNDSDFMAENITGLYTMEFSLPAPNGVSDPAYLQMLDAYKSWWLENPKVMHVASISDIFKRLNKNMHGDDPDSYRVPEAADLAAQYLLLYEFSLPFGLDLNNTINIDKSASRFTVVFEHLKSAETRQIAREARHWLETNAPEHAAFAVSPAVMFAFIAERNFSSMAIGIPLALLGISILLILALRSLKFGLLSVVPNLFPIGMAFGLWALYSGEINFAMSFSMGVVLGIIVDDTIHFLSKYLRARRELGLSTEEAIIYAFRTVGTALLVTSLVLAGGFLVLSWSAFYPTVSMSLLNVMAIFSALAVDFFLLPALLLRLDRAPARSPANSSSEPTEPDHETAYA